MMNFNKKQGKFLSEIINRWESDETISKEMAGKLRDSFSIKPFDWKRLAKYSFWIAIICGVIAFQALITDRSLIEQIEKLFKTSETGLCISFALLASGAYFFGFRRRNRKPEKIFSNEFVVFSGVLFTAASVGYLGIILDSGSGHFSLLFLLSFIIYGIIGLLLRSKLVWIFAIISFGSWFGTETGYISGWGVYFLGMNYPLRFILPGILLIGASFYFQGSFKLSFFYKPTYVMGMLYLFISLWILSVFGNYGDIEEWYDVKQSELFYWGIIFAAAALGAIYYGLKRDDNISKSFGITFLFINLYTRYFEYFWDASEKAIFFAVLGVSFWLIGWKAEKIWNLEFLNQGKSEEEN